MLLALALVTLGGCTEDGTIDPPLGDAPSDGNTTTPPPTPGGGGTDPTNATNTPPVANLTTDAVNGTAPLNVTFTLDATDAEGDNLTWILAVNGTEVANGTALPATVEHNFTEPGNLTVLLRVSDGDATGDASLVVVVEAGIVDAERDPTRFSGAVATGSTPIGESGTNPGAMQCAGWLTGQNGQDCRWWTLAEDYDGHEFKLPNSADDLEFYDACEATGTSLGVFTTDGTVPAGAGCVVLWYYGLAPTGATVAVDIY